MSLYKGLTLEEIIQCLTDQNNEVDSKLINIFIYTYRSYCQPLDIIRIISKRLNYLNDENLPPDSSSSESSRFTKAIIILFNIWLTIPFSYDFYEIPDFRSLNELLKCVREWPESILFIKTSTCFVKSFNRLEVMIDSVLFGFNSMDNSERADFHEMAVDCKFRESYFFDCRSKSKEPQKSLFDFTPETIAESLSASDQIILQKLRLPELIMYPRKQAAPSVRHVIDTYNQLHNVVKLTVRYPSVVTRRFDTEYPYPGDISPGITDDPMLSPSYSGITGQSKKEKRYFVVEKWILAAQILHRLRNFSSLVAILTALTSTDLKKCMKVLKINKSPKLLNLYKSLLKAIEPYINQNKEEVPDLRCNLSEIPYLGIYLRSMTYIHEGFPDYVKSSINVYNGNSDKLINVDKCRRQFDVMAQVKLLISSLNFNHIKEDKAFSDWFRYMNIESRKSQRYSTDDDLLNPSMSLESLKSSNSSESLNSLERSTCDSKSNTLQSHERLDIPDCTLRFRSSPSTEAHSPAYSTDPKLATVKLKESRNNTVKFGLLSNTLHYSSAGKVPKSKNKSDTISFGSESPRDRPSVLNMSRSVNHNDLSMDSVQYKKIKIYEKDRTGDFISRVLDKFGKQNLLSDDFDVVQILDTNKEILIKSNANLFYALAEKSEYLIEVRRKEIITA